MTDKPLIEEQETELIFDGKDQAAKLALELISEARQEICIFGPIIDPILFDNRTASEKLSQFARLNERTRIRIVVIDTQKNVVNNHHILSLAHKLTSSIQIRLVDDKYKGLYHQYVVIDHKAYLFCPVANRYQGRVIRHSSAKILEIRKKFENIWINSKPDHNSRRLSL